MSAGTIVSGFAAAGNICLWLSQVPNIYKLIKEGDATQYSWLPSLTLVGTMSLWSAYTVFAIPTPEIMTANWTGVIIPFIYLCIFVYYSKTAYARMKISLATLAVLAVTWSFSLGVYLSPPTTQYDKNSVVGGVTVAVNVSFFMSPLRQIYLGVVGLDSSRIPILLSATAVVQSSLWVATAVLVKDNFILTVNAIGLCFAIFQISCISYIRIALYRRQARLAATSASSGDLQGSATKELPSESTAGGDSSDSLKSLATSENGGTAPASGTQDGDSLTASAVSIAIPVSS